MRSKQRVPDMLLQKRWKTGHRKQVEKKSKYSFISATLLVNSPPMDF